jgi:hypothetical protein
MKGLALPKESFRTGPRAAVRLTPSALWVKSIRARLEKRRAALFWSVLGLSQIPRPRAGRSLSR